MVKLPNHRLLARAFYRVPAPAPAPAPALGLGPTGAGAGARAFGASAGRGEKEKEKEREEGVGGKEHVLEEGDTVSFIRSFVILSYIMPNYSLDDFILSYYLSFLYAY